MLVIRILKFDFFSLARRIKFQSPTDLQFGLQKSSFISSDVEAMENILSLTVDGSQKHAPPDNSNGPSWQFCGHSACRRTARLQELHN